MDHSLAVTKVANTIFHIWQKADCCPPSVPAIKKKVEKLIRERKNFLTTCCPQVPDPKPEPSQSTKRCFLPSIGWKASKRIYSSGVISQETDIHKEVSGIFEMLLIMLESEEDVCSKPVPLERISLILRNNCLPEQSWKKEIGLQLFDVFSDTARKKSLASGFAFDEAFLLDQRRVFKKYTADRIV